MNFASRAGEKLEHALKTFQINPSGFTCADFGSSTGGFVDCLLQHGAQKVYAIDTGYGGLDWKLRNDPRVMVMERTNAMHVVLPEKVDLITIDTSWTRLEKTILSAMANLKPAGKIIALAKLHYEAKPEQLRLGVLSPEQAPEVLGKVKEKMKTFGLKILGETESPVRGGKGGNREYLLYLQP